MNCMNSKTKFTAIQRLSSLAHYQNHCKALHINTQPLICFHPMIAATIVIILLATLHDNEAYLFSTYQMGP